MGPDPNVVSRRTLLVAGAGVPAAVVLAGCGESDPTSTSPYSAPSNTEPESPDASGPAEASDSPEPSATSEQPDAEQPAGRSLAAVDDIPEGGALVVQDGPGGRPVVLARPRGDEVVAFSAVCTHQGCTVRAEQAGLRCPCHGSTYDLTGDNTGGPAPSPLPRVRVTVADGQVRPA